MSFFFVGPLFEQVDGRTTLFSEKIHSKQGLVPMTAAPNDADGWRRGRQRRRLRSPRGYAEHQPDPVLLGRSGCGADA